MSISSLGEFLEWAEYSFLESELHFGHGTDNPWDEAVAIARHVLELPIDSDTSVLERKLNNDELKAMLQLMEMRIRERIPLPYLIQESWFAGQKFYVDERVLIPRSPLGELIEKQFQPWIKRKGVKRILISAQGVAASPSPVPMPFRKQRSMRSIFLPRH